MRENRDPNGLTHGLAGRLGTGWFELVAAMETPTIGLDLLISVKAPADWAPQAGRCGESAHRGRDWALRCSVAPTRTGTPWVSRWASGRGV